jgi:hypothetical protein
LTPAAVPAAQATPTPPAASKPAFPARKTEVVRPFEATLRTILYSQDRKLAIIDGHIVGVGDEIRGARVSDITGRAVLLRDAQGRLRRLVLRAIGR